MRQSVSRMCCWVLAFTSAAVIFAAASPSNRASGKLAAPLSFASSRADADEDRKWRAV